MSGKICFVRRDMVISIANTNPDRTLFVETLPAGKLPLFESDFNQMSTSIKQVA